MPAAGTPARSAGAAGTEMGSSAWEEERIWCPREAESPGEGDEGMEGLRRGFVLCHAVCWNHAVY